MFDPAQITIGQVSSVLRDFAIVFSVIGASWKARGIYDSGKQFFTRCNSHMDVMENGMNTLLTNHLKHIEADLAKLTGRDEKPKV